jgi:stage III sporulation protein SpoIIIAA
MQERRITDDLEVLLDVLPPTIVESLRKIGRFGELIEVVMDLGRPPEARYVDSSQNGSATASEDTMYLRENEVTRADLDYILERVRDFDDDNRAGITRTLHRLSAIKNRKQETVGMTCRVGRAVYGTLEIIEDIISSGKSILLLGRPGVGKTTLLREAARVLADNKRVVIVDTSNEIGGDGDIPHPAVGRARRMQVSAPSRQHEVMIEAVENHNPQVIVIDEIGREAEAEAARTIAERGVQLIGTAHGQTLDNMMMNPTLNDLIGGIESVTLSDEEARRRGTQKTVLERRAPPTFDVLVEIRDRHRLLVHHNVSDAVDALLRNKMPTAELRFWDDKGEMHRQMVRIARTEKDQDELTDERPHRRSRRELRSEELRARNAPRREGEEMRVMRLDEYEVDADDRKTHEAPETPVASGARKPTRLYIFGVSKNRMRQAIKQLGVNAILVDTLEEADVLLTAKSYYRQRPRIISDAEQDNKPIYVLRSNSVTQMENALADLFSLSDGDSAEEALNHALSETEEAIQRVHSGERVVSLTPQNSFIRRKQHELARSNKLISHSYGKEPTRHVRIYRE